MDQEKRKNGFEGCEIEYNVDPPERRGGNRERIYKPFLDRFMDDDDAVTIRVKANDKRQASNIAVGLRQTSKHLGYDNISIRQINEVYVYVSKN